MVMMSNSSARFIVSMLAVTYLIPSSVVAGRTVPLRSTPTTRNAPFSFARLVKDPSPQPASRMVFLIGSPRRWSNKGMRT